MTPMLARAISAILGLLLGLTAAACGGGSARGSSGAGRTPTRDAPPAQEDPVPPSDRGLATWPREDAPPFPVTQFPAVIGPQLDASLPPDRLARIAEFIRWYERDPYDPRMNRWGQSGISTRAAILMWVVASPDVHVVAGTFLQAMATDRGEDGELVGRYVGVGAMIGMAAHAIERPGLDPRDPVRQAAGIESALRWYEAGVRRGGPRSPLLDELLAVRDRGELVTWFSQRVRFTD